MATSVTCTQYSPPEQRVSRRRAVLQIIGVGAIALCLLVGLIATSLPSIGHTYNVAFPIEHGLPDRIRALGRTWLSGDLCAQKIRCTGSVTCYTADNMPGKNTLPLVEVGSIRSLHGAPYPILRSPAAGQYPTAVFVFYHRCYVRYGLSGGA